MNDWLTAIKNSKVAHLNKHLQESATQLSDAKKQKYNNVIVEFDGKTFRSKKELGKYIALRSKEAAGEIKDLQVQVPFQLNEGGTHSFTYVCDFAYVVVKTGEYVVEDTKGKRTKLFDKKEKLMLKIHDIQIKIS